jgi:isoamyl acetate esterase
MTYQRPSDAWTSTWPEGEEGYRESRACLAKLNCAYLEKIALSARKAQCQDQIDAVDLECTIDPSRFDGAALHIMLEVAFSDGTYWLARVDTFPPNKGDHTIMLSELATMKVIKERTSIPVPAIYAHSPLPSGDFAYPFVLLEWLPGRHLDTPFVDFPESRRDRLAEQLASILHQLAKLRFDTLGRIWSGENLDQEPRIIHSISLETGEVPHPYPRTSSDWYDNETQAVYKRALQHCNWVRHKLRHSKEFREAVSQSSESEQALVRSVARRRHWKTATIIRQDCTARLIAKDHTHGPFPVCHIALDPSHMLFDEEYNITGIIQWKYAQTMPIEQLMIVPGLYVLPSAHFNTKLTDPSATRDELAPLPDPLESVREANEAKRAAANSRMSSVADLTEELAARLQSIEDPEVRATFDRLLVCVGKEALRHALVLKTEAQATPKPPIGAIEDNGFKAKGADGTLQDCGGSSGDIEASIRDLLYTVDSKNKAAEDAPEKPNRHFWLRYSIAESLLQLEREWQRKHDIHGPPGVVMGEPSELLPTELSSLLLQPAWGELAFLNHRKSPWTFIPGAKRMLEVMDLCPDKDWDDYLQWRCRETEPMILGLGNWYELGPEPKTE